MSTVFVPHVRHATCVQKLDTCLTHRAAGSGDSCAATAQAALTELQLEFGAERDTLHRRVAAADQRRDADAASAQQARQEAQLLRAQFQARTDVGAVG